ncbi:hypothetical protein A9X05_27505 [Mycobacterium sp. E3298]|nr:hypothetical protein A9X05_27505 [Mycobacterium sp. E3298]
MELRDLLEAPWHRFGKYDSHFCVQSGYSFCQPLVLRLACLALQRCFELCHPSFEQQPLVI